MYRNLKSNIEYLKLVVRQSSNTLVTLAAGIILPSKIVRLLINL